MWDERYASDEYAYGTEPNDFLVTWLRNDTSGTALSIADGEGRNGVWLAEQGLEVHTFDGSRVGVTKALRLALSKKVTIDAVVDDMRTYEIAPSSFDVVVSIFAHTDAATRRDLHRRVVRGLRPGGVVILEAYSPAQLAFGTGGPKDVSLLVTTEMLRDEFDGLDIEHLVEIERDVVEGTLHTGRAAVVQIVARKPKGA